MKNAQQIAQKNLPKPHEIKAWLVSYIANLLELNQDEIDTQVPFENYGLDSSATVILSGDLAEWLECELEPSLLYDYTTIEALIQYLTEKK